MTMNARFFLLHGEGHNFKIAYFNDFFISKKLRFKLPTFAVHDKVILHVCNINQFVMVILPYKQGMTCDKC